MPVRIYEIAKRLGLESRDVLAKARELGIAAARIPSSSLDKITAEYLEEKLGGQKISEAPAPQPTQPIVVVGETPTAPPEVAEATPPAAILETAAPAESVTAQPPPIDDRAAEAKAPTQPEIPAEPPPPAGPKVGEKIGSIQLPPKPRLGEKLGSVKLPQRDASRGGDFGRGPQRGIRRMPTAPSRTSDSQSAQPGAQVALPESAPVIIVKPPIVVRELAEQMKLKPFKIIADSTEGDVTVLFVTNKAFRIDYVDEKSN